MSAKNTAVFGLYPDETELLEAIEELKCAGFRTTDLSMLVPENLGSKDIGHEKHSKAPEGAVAGGIAGAVIGGALAWLSSAGVISGTPRLRWNRVKPAANGGAAASYR